MKYFITDIHGDFKGMQLLLKHAGVDLSKDQLVFGGDMIDRGKESAEVVKAIKSLVDSYPNVHAIIGNHEEMMGDYFRNGDRLWMSHGGQETLRSLKKLFPDEIERNTFINWATSLPLLFEDNEFVYTHAGLNPYEPLDKQSREILWMPESDFYTIPGDALLTLTHNKPIIHGHTPVEYIYFDNVRLNGDLGSNTYSIEGERALGLVNLTEMVYYVYKQAEKKIEERKIVRL
ncbi:metallophosphoesterase family protein [Paenibacillus sp. JTLBN-2024]